MVLNPVRNTFYLKTARLQHPTRAGVPSVLGRRAGRKQEMQEIKVFRPGTDVRISCDVTTNGIQARINEICLQENHVSYRVVWWDGCTRHTEWLEAHEVRAVRDRTKQIEIGFHKGD